LALETPTASPRQWQEIRCSSAVWNGTSCSRPHAEPAFP